MRLCTIAAVLFAVQLAAAQELPVEAARRYDAGIAALEQSDWAGALVELEAARGIRETTKIVYNIAFCLKSLNRAAEALVAYERVIELGVESLPASARGHVERNVADLRGRVGDLTVRTNVEGAEILVNGEVARRMPVHVDLYTSVTVEARREGYRPARTTTRATRAGPLEAALTLEPVAGATVAGPPPGETSRPVDLRPRREARDRAAPATQPQPEPEAESGGSMLPWILGGAGVAALGAGLGVFLYVYANRETLEGDAVVNTP